MNRKVELPFVDRAVVRQHALIVLSLCDQLESAERQLSIVDDELKTNDGRGVGRIGKLRELKKEAKHG